jgi:hypothetical protein
MSASAGVAVCWPMGAAAERAPREGERIHEPAPSC